MLGSFLSTIGGNIGRYFGGGILSAIGRYAGRYLGNFLERKWFHEKESFQKYSSLKESFTLSMARAGSPIPLVFGKARVGGKIIWCDEIKNIARTTSSSKYFTAPKQIKSTTYYTEYEYFLSFAMCICEGEITEIGRVWNSSEPIDIAQYKFRLYKGSGSQMPDPYILSKMNMAAPAFRDLAYIFFEDLPLGDFGDIIPDLSFEVTRKANVPGGSIVEDMVKSIVMIPGSGEYVYDTIIQKKQLLTQDGSVKAEESINLHNFYNLPDSVQSLNQLNATCGNVEWVAPVVCWFASSLNLAECLIRPAVEFKDPLVSFSQEWRVGAYDRNSAHEIFKDAAGNPRYGGSINDQSVIRYLQELKARGLKIMFYPMFFMDVDQKPWRGRLTGEAAEIANFFNKPQGYNAFILHYASLVRDHVDAFIIGSELIGLTRLKSPGGDFPAVTELVSLAQRAKAIVGQRVLVSYAADWSEYHHTEGGWFNLDLLWASEHVDFIGIDAYFPVTGSESSVISDADLKAGFSSGEGYDYYLDRDNNRLPLAPAFAWKNLKYWWENPHVNPDGQASRWQPRSKKIWFTEYGFPSIDKSSNQPNVFFDPFCLDGGVPKYSNGGVDFFIQRRCIRAFLEFWNKEEYIENMFLWTWDARPYPAWPHMNIWRDGYLWEKGHWVNGKFGACSVASIILEVSKRCRINLGNLDVSTVDEALAGAILTSQLSGREALDILRSAYFFDTKACSEQKISFIKRGQLTPVKIDHKGLVKLSETGYVYEINIPQEEVLTKVDIYFLHQIHDYKTGYLHINSEDFSNLKNAGLRLPFVLSCAEVEKIGRLLLKNAAAETRLFEFNLPISHLALEPADFVLLEHQGIRHQVRVIKIRFSGLMMNAVAIMDDISNYHNMLPTKNQHELFYQETIDLQFRIIELPFKLRGYDFPHFVACLNSNARLPLYAKIKQNLEEDWAKITMLEPANSIAKIVSFNAPAEANFFLIDEVSSIEIKVSGPVPMDQDSWKLLEVGGEIIAFRKIRGPDENNIYFLSHLIRGAYGSEKYARKHETGGSATILSKQLNVVPVARELAGQAIQFKVGSVIQETCFANSAELPAKPVIVSSVARGSILYVKWLRRNFATDSWLKEDNRVFELALKITAGDQTMDHIALSSAGSAEIDINNIDISGGYHLAIM